MYDSDEVRDKVRMEMMGMALSPGARIWEPSPEERAALAEARMAFSRELQAALATVGEAAERADRLEHLRAAMQEWASEFRQAVEEVLRPLMERLGALLKSVGDRFRELAGIIGLLEEGDAPEPFPWQRRPRTPSVRPARPVDAVAAGRHPAMAMRTRIRGGRR